MERADLNSTVSWGAILAGGAAAAAVTLLVTAFGIGAGLAVVSPWEGDGISATTASWAAGLFLVAVAMIASTIGGYITGRLRPGWEDVNVNERFFRDTAHGFVTWAFATVLTATVLAGAGTHLLAAASAGSLTAAGAGAAQSASASTSNSGDVYIDRLLRTGPQSSGQPAQGDATASRAELLRIIAPASRKGGEVSADDRAYAARLVASRTGLPQAEAEQRVSQAITQAKDAADKARLAAMKLSLWIAASLLAGALAGCLGAVEGGKLRSSRWYEEGTLASTTPVMRS